jgi:hypothetical protein
MREEAFFRFKDLKTRKSVHDFAKKRFDLAGEVYGRGLLMFAEQSRDGGLSASINLIREGAA